MLIQIKKKNKHNELILVPILVFVYGYFMEHAYE